MTCCSNMPLCFYRTDIQLSLNGKDVIDGADDTPLASLGIVSGDLVFVLGIEDEQSSSHSQQKPAAQRPGILTFLNTILSFIYN